MKLFGVIIICCFFSSVTSFAQNWSVFDTSALGVSGIDSSGLLFGIGKIRGDYSGNIYVSVGGKGLYWFKNDQWSPFKQPEFIFQVQSMDVFDFLFDENNELWAATGNALHYFKNNSPIVTTYNQYNAPISGTLSVVAVKQDHRGNILFGNGGGISLFDRNAIWKLFETGYVTDIACYDDGTILLACGSEVFASNGAIIFNSISETWINYNTFNSPLPTNTVVVFNKDFYGNYWFATRGGGLVKLSDNNWQIFNTVNSGIPSDTINHMLITGGSDIWLATTNGLAKFDGTDWTVYNTGNSPLPSDHVNFLHADLYGNLWLTTNFHVVRIENAVSSIREEAVKHDMFNVYPNPASDKIFIGSGYDFLKDTEVVIYDINGKAVSKRRFHSGEKIPYKIDISSMESGIYYLQLKDAKKSVLQRVVINR